MPLEEFVVQFKLKQGGTSGSLQKSLLFVFNSSKGDNGFVNISLQKNIFVVVVLEFDDSCYVDVKQYRFDLRDNQCGQRCNCIMQY